MEIKLVKDQEEGLEIAKKLLYEAVDEKTLLLLSGGSLKNLYEMLAWEKRLKPLAVALVDERFGGKMHDSSNEKMIRETGFVSDLETRGVEFFSVLAEGKNIVKTAQDYEQTLKELFAKAKKKIALMGVGPDGHTSGIAPNRPDFLNPLFSQNDRLVGYFDDAKGTFGKRVTTTFNALSQMNELIILAFGSSKQEPLRKMFEEGPVEEIPARFYTKPDISNKVILITDQKM